MSDKQQSDVQCIRGEYIKHLKVSAKEIYKVLTNFEQLYGTMTDMDKKKFYRTLIEKIEVHDNREKQSGGIIKKVIFKFPIFIGGQMADSIVLTKKMTVECIVSMKK